MHGCYVYSPTQEQIDDWKQKHVGCEPIGLCIVESALAKEWNAIALVFKAVDGREYFINVPENWEKKFVVI